MSKETAMIASPSDYVCNITKAIDEHPIGALVLQVGALCALAAFLDGMDTTTISAAAPAIMEQLKLSQSHLGPIFSSGLLGAMLGALGFGPLADSFGRKRMLIIAVMTFGIFTILTAAAASLPSLLLVRFFAGIGLGGAAPCFIALASEYTPASRRARVLSLIWAAFGLGGILGAFASSYLLRHFTWHTIFLTGGVLALAAALLFMAWLPESLRFLLIKGGDTARVFRIGSRIVPALQSHVRIVADEEKLSGTPIANLFSQGRATNTLLLWLSSFTIFGSTVAFFWATALMYAHGISLAQAAIVPGVAGIGSLLGAASVGRLMERFGAMAILLPAFLLGGLALGAVGYAAASLLWMIIDLALVGIFAAGAGVSGALVLAAVSYPTAMRSTGVGWAVAMGRFGQVLMPLAISLLLAFGWPAARSFIGIGFTVILGGAACFVLLRRQEAKPVLTKEDIRPLQAIEDVKTGIGTADA